MKYEVIKDLDERHWKKGDVVMVLCEKEFTSPYLVPFYGDAPAKHVLVYVDPVNLAAKQN